MRPLLSPDVAEAAANAFEMQPWRRTGPVVGSHLPALLRPLPRDLQQSSVQASLQSALPSEAHVEEQLPKAQEQPLVSSPVDTGPFAGPQPPRLPAEPHFLSRDFMPGDQKPFQQTADERRMQSSILTNVAAVGDLSSTSASMPGSTSLLAKVSLLPRTTCLGSMPLQSAHPTEFTQEAASRALPLNAALQTNSSDGWSTAAPCFDQKSPGSPRFSACISKNGCDGNLSGSVANAARKQLLAGKSILPQREACLDQRHESWLAVDPTLEQRSAAKVPAPDLDCKPVLVPAQQKLSLIPPVNRLHAEERDLPLSLHVSTAPLSTVYLRPGTQITSDETSDSFRKDHCMSVQQCGSSFHPNKDVGCINKSVGLAAPVQECEEARISPTTFGILPSKPQQEQPAMSHQERVNMSMVQDFLQPPSRRLRASDTGRLRSIMLCFELACTQHMHTQAFYNDACFVHIVNTQLGRADLFASQRIRQESC